MTTTTTAVGATNSIKRELLQLVAPNVREAKHLCPRVQAVNTTKPVTVRSLPLTPASYSELGVGWTFYSAHCGFCELTYSTPPACFVLQQGGLVAVDEADWADEYQERTRFFETFPLPDAAAMANFVHRLLTGNWSFHA